MQKLKQRTVAIVIGSVLCLVIIVGTANTVVTSFNKKMKSAAAPTAMPKLSPTPGTGSLLPDPADLPPGKNWTQYRFDIDGTGTNPEPSISEQNIKQLTQRWESNSFAAIESTPAIVDGVIYVTSGNALYAFDVRTGAEIWQFNDDPQKKLLISSSVAVDPQSHIAYYGTPEARVYAINTLTGTELWHMQLGDPAHGANIWSSPLLVNSKLYIGLASDDDNPCVRGAVFALDPKDGHSIWIHYTVDANQLGGAVWSSLIARSAAHEIIATTGNPCPWGASFGQSDSFVALDWDTGETHWEYKALPSDNCDCDFGEGAVDFDYQGQEYLVAGNKFGKVYALKPPTADHGVELAWSLAITKPGFLAAGGIFEPPTYRNGIVYMAGGPSLDGACRQGELFALQANSGAVLWSSCTAGQVVSPSVIIGGVLLVAQDKKVVGYASRTGKVLWQAAYQGLVWGGISVSRGFVVVGTVAGKLYCFSLKV